jgi:hypothetical protein
MPRPYSEELRLRVVHAVESGKTTCEVGAIFQVTQTPIRVGDRSATFILSRSAVVGELCWNTTKPSYQGNYRTARSGVERSAGLVRM